MAKHKEKLKVDELIEILNSKHKLLIEHELKTNIEVLIKNIKEKLTIYHSEPSKEKNLCATNDELNDTNFANLDKDQIGNKPSIKINNKKDERNYRDIYSNNKFLRFASSLHYKITYIDVDFNVINNHFNRIYENQIESITTEVNKVIVKLKFNTPQRLKLYHKNLYVNLSYPFSVENKPHKHLKLLKEEKTNPTNCLNLNEKVDILKQFESAYEKFPWLYLKEYYFEKSWVSNKDKNYKNKSLKKKIINQLELFCFDLNEFKGNKFCNYLKAYLKNLDVKFFNEYIISSIFLNFLIEMNDKQKSNLNSQQTDFSNIEVIAVDHKFEEEISGIISHFRCVIIIRILK